MENLSYLAPVAGIIGLLFALYLTNRVNQGDPGNKRMRELGDAIHEGAMAFLNREYRTLSVFVVVLFVALGFAINWSTAVCFVIGALFSGTAGYIGMNIATKANTRTANAARKGENAALIMAFSGGSVMGMTVVGLGLLGVGVLYLIFKDPTIVNGYALGASSIALFARVGGGIYTKAADVGADLVGKVEAGIPEDDPRNPATIADNVGDNVGDVAGMGADLFESYVGSIIAAITIGFVQFGVEGIILPLLVAAVGVVSAVIGFFFVRAKEGVRLSSALERGTLASAFIVIIVSFFLTQSIIGESGPFWAIIAGLVSGIIIGRLTEYYTSDSFKPVQSIAESSKT
ncbi:MAG TPA: sodium/proton-translocating pyrophosphatase, partial [Firmicutes bacterium]|nr:sodium/proton-translocating pyrophosphatase [Bacillota bacterium]